MGLRLTKALGKTQLRHLLNFCRFCPQRNKLCAAFAAACKQTMKRCARASLMCARCGKIGQG